EVFDGADTPEWRWQQAHSGALTEAAITNGAYEWEWHRYSWGVLFEIAFRVESRWEAFRNLPAVRAALDAAPDPVNGVLTYPGPGTVEQRRHRDVLIGQSGADIWVSVDHGAIEADVVEVEALDVQVPAGLPAHERRRHGRDRVGEPDHPVVDEFAAAAPHDDA